MVTGLNEYSIIWIFREYLNTQIPLWAFECSFQRRYMYCLAIIQCAWYRKILGNTQVIKSFCFCIYIVLYTKIIDISCILQWKKIFGSGEWRLYIQIVKSTIRLSPTLLQSDTCYIATVKHMSLYLNVNHIYLSIVYSTSAESL